MQIKTDKLSINIRSWDSRIYREPYSIRYGIAGNANYPEGARVYLLQYLRKTTLFPRRLRKNSRCLAFEVFTKIRTASREVGRYHRHARPFTIAACSWCPAALSYAAVLMTRKPASNRFVFPDWSSSGFLRNSRDRRDDPPRWVFRSRHPGSRSSR